MYTLTRYSHSYSQQSQAQATVVGCSNSFNQWQRSYWITGCIYRMQWQVYKHLLPLVCCAAYCLCAASTNRHILLAADIVNYDRVWVQSHRFVALPQTGESKVCCAGCSCHPLCETQGHELLLAHYSQGNHESSWLTMILRYLSSQQTGARSHPHQMCTQRGHCLLCYDAEGDRPAIIGTTLKVGSCRQVTILGQGEKCASWQLAYLWCNDI